MSDTEITVSEEKKSEIRNPFLIALWCPLYLLGFSICTATDMLWVVLFLIMTLGLLFAYVSEFKILPSLYANEVIHKVAVSSLLGIVFGFLIGMTARALMDIDQGSDTGGGTLSGANYLAITWAVTAIPGYIVCVWRIFSVNKRDLEAEHREREEKRKKRKKGGPPIMEKDGF